MAEDSMTMMCSGFAARDGKMGSGRDGAYVPRSVFTIVSHGSPLSEPDYSLM